MDPVTALRTIHGDLKDLDAMIVAQGPQEEIADQIDSVIESLTGLLDWVNKGGFIPPEAGQR